MRRDEHCPASDASRAATALASSHSLRDRCRPRARRKRAGQDRSRRHSRARATRDAHADRVILVPTAETHPQGTLFLSVYELVIPAIGYAVTDRVHAVGHRADRFRERVRRAQPQGQRAAQPRSARGADQQRSTTARGEDDGELLFGRAGGTRAAVFRAGLPTSLSLHAMLVAHDELDTILPIGLGAGFTAQVGES